MAVSSSTLKVSLTESIILNGIQQGSTNTIKLGGIKNISKRIITIPTSEIEIVAFSTAVASGTFIESDVLYMRFTNKDTDNHVILTFKNENNNECAIKLDYGQSYIYNIDRVGGVVDTIDASQSEVGTFTDATTDYTSGALTVTCDTNTKIKVGQTVDGGSKTQSGSTVATVNTPGAVTSFTMSLSSSESGTNASTTFAGPIMSDLVNVTAKSNAAACDLEMFIASK